MLKLFGWSKFSLNSGEGFSWGNKKGGGQGWGILGLFIHSFIHSFIIHLFIIIPITCDCFLKSLPLIWTLRLFSRKAHCLTAGNPISPDIYSLEQAQKIVSRLVSTPGGCLIPAPHGPPSIVRRASAPWKGRGEDVRWGNECPTFPWAKIIGLAN